MSTTSESNKVERAVILYSSIHLAPPPPSAIPPNTPTPASKKNMTSQRWIWFFLAGLIITVPFAICAYRNPTGTPIICLLYIFQLILVIGTIFTSAAEHQEDILFMILFLATLGFFVSSTSPNPYPLSVDEAMTATFVVAVQFLHSIILATPVSILAFLCASRVRFQEDIGNETRFKYYISDPPEEMIRQPFEALFHLHLFDKDIAKALQDYYDMSKYGLSTRSVKCLCTKWGLKGTRQQKHMLDSIWDAVVEAHIKYPFRGAKSIRDYLFDTKDMQIPRELLEKYFRETEPEQVGVPPELIQELEDEYAPANHEVFQLTPLLFHQAASIIYTQMGNPEVNFSSFWTIYRNVLSGLQIQVAQVAGLELAVNLHAATVQRMNSDEDEINKMELLPNQKHQNLHDTTVGLQDVAGDGDGAGNESEIPYALFSSDDEEEDL
ncbi:hypothetical protein GYMLUDRAFT_246999 [Collybiopsis luxurians FD-317 M1]|uniref:Uncharacterized protein n=1 Tax=Collybiopsis luxurians FD-317 M1 TaxID=944289 RepID=A0A0D0BQF3_9AGAR|nr:hypothetical protein GYMLUDRAFT_246999 [Collybiopsis luxurians FD-317 M1]